MSNYTQTTFFTPKDSLPITNPAKTIFGAAYDVEFGNISTAIATKLDATSISAAPVAFNLGTTAAPGITFVGELGTGWSSNGSGDLIGSTTTAARITIAGTTGNVTIAAPSAGTALSVAGFAGANVAVLGGLAVATAGNVSIAAPSSGTALTVIGETAGVPIASFIGTTTLGIDFDDLSAFPSNQVRTVIGTSTAALSPSGTSGDLLLIPRTSAACSVAICTGSTTPSARLVVSGTGSVTVNAPSSGTALGVTSLAGFNALLLTAPNSAGNSFGLSIIAGTTAADYAVNITNAPGTTLLQLKGDGGMLLGSPTGGDQGLGTLNATGLFVNGAAVVVPTSGSFTGTITGCTTAPTATFNWQKSGNQVTLYCSAGLSATSNSTACTFTGSNAPNSAVSAVQGSVCAVFDNGAVSILGAAQVGNGTSTITIGKGGIGGTFTAVGTKGIPANWTITYTV